MDIIKNDEKELKQFFHDQLCKENKKGVQKFVEALVDNLLDNDSNKLELFGRAILNFEELPAIDLNGTYYVNLSQLRDWKFDSQATADQLGVLRKDVTTLNVKSIEFSPYRSPQYKIKVDVITNATHEIMEYEESVPIYYLHKVDNFPI